MTTHVTIRVTTRVTTRVIRFTPVVRLDHPQPLSYDNFLESTDATNFQARDLYAAAAESFLQVTTPLYASHLHVTGLLGYDRHRQRS